MGVDFENELSIGNGIYTIREIARILRLPYSKVHRWLNTYWEGELGKFFEGNYSWKVENSQAVGFHTLIEFYILVQFAEAGVKTREVLKAHIELSKELQTPFPFAQRNVLEKIRTDGKKIFLTSNGITCTLDGTKQLNLSFIRLFLKNLEFDSDLVASRFWPLGKDKGILVDPRRKFGHPVVNTSNIYPETIYNLYKAGEPEKFIAFTYEISEEDVRHAIEYCEAA
ncbi:DUF433 domain-containing protein [Rhodohalobacter mucosus]|uniref:DUF433 domain-containing protein n=1 Tax=Rhodohalobacter mucosus TaxID=2079485 RepID=A0A316TR15_9BACT|nr:DUF433 domain-containing protein [Rhodohalobacter mucosus]PWN06860.1 DUF433 domain-containing protein [Rhodohalobacter mucosus]